MQNASNVKAESRKPYPKPSYVSDI